MHIVILYTLPTRRALASSYIESDTDTKDSADEVADALQSKGYTIQLFPISEDAIDTIASIRADLVFNLTEWTGQDMVLVPRVFDALGKLRIPYTGATKENYLVTADKVQMKILLEKYGLPTARWQAFTTADETVRADFIYPVLIKPALEHCSIGLSREALAHTVTELKNKVKTQIETFHQAVVAEEFIDGQEYQVTVLEIDGKPWVLPPAEITFDLAGEEAFLTFAGRWDETSSEYANSHTRIATLSHILQESIEQISKDTFHTFGFRDYARLDLRIRKSEIFILEPNSNPGLGDSDDYGMTLSHRAVGMTFADFIEKIVQSAFHRFYL